MENWLSHAQRIARVVQLVHPGCSVCFRRPGDTTALSLRVLSSRGRILFSLPQIAWLEEVPAMSDEQVLKRVAGSSGPIGDNEGFSPLNAARNVTALGRMFRRPSQ
jgi:hypothetical protein